MEAKADTAQTTSQLQDKASLGDLAAADSRLSSAIGTKANSADLQAATDSRHPLINAAAPLSQSLVSGLEEALNTAAAAAEIADGQLTIAMTGGLQATLDAKQALLSDLEGTRVSLLHGPDRLRKIFGHGGIEITTGFNALDATHQRIFRFKCLLQAWQLRSAL